MQRKRGEREDFRSTRLGISGPFDCRALTQVNLKAVEVAWRGLMEARRKEKRQERIKALWETVGRLATARTLPWSFLIDQILVVLDEADEYQAHTTLWELLGDNLVRPDMNAGKLHLTLGKLLSL